MYVYLYYCTNLHMPMFAKCSDHSLLNGTTTSTTDWNSHLVMTTQAIQLILKHNNFLIKIHFIYHYIFNFASIAYDVKFIIRYYFQQNN